MFTCSALSRASDVGAEAEALKSNQPGLPMRIRSKFLMYVRDFDVVVGAYNITIR
jgi:hypothetical protein